MSANIIAATNLQEMVAANPMPTTFHGDALLFGANLAAMTAFTCLGAMVVGWMLISIVSHRHVDKLWHPVTIYRMQWACAASALMIRAGTAAASLWAWDQNAARTAARVLTAQRYLDPLSLAFAAGWLVLLALSYPAMVAQLRKRPYPVEMLAQASELKVPAAVVGLSILAAGTVAWLRSQGV